MPERDASSSSGLTPMAPDARGRDFLKLCGVALKGATEHCAFNVAIRPASDLADFLFDARAGPAPAAPRSAPRRPRAPAQGLDRRVSADKEAQSVALKNFAQIDLHLVGGSAALLPWQPSAAPLLAFINQARPAHVARGCGGLAGACGRGPASARLSERCKPALHAEAEAGAGAGSCSAWWRRRGW